MLIPIFKFSYFNERILNILNKNDTKVYINFI